MRPMASLLAGSYEFGIYHTRKSRKHLAKSLQMLLQDFAQRLRVEVIVVLKLQNERLAFRRGLQRRLVAELFDLIQVELPLLAEKSAMQRLGVLGAQIGP